MTGWEIITSIVGTGVTAAVGFVWGRVWNHEGRITTLEAEVRAEFRHIADGLRDIKATQATSSREIHQIKENLARGER